MKARSVRNPLHIYELSADNYETTPETMINGEKVRPHIVFFQEDVPNFTKATELVHESDIFLIIGTSLAVYPAAALLHYVRPGTPVYYIDPNPAQVPQGVNVIPLPATKGVTRLKELLGAD